MPKRLARPVRRQMNLMEAAHDRLRALNMTFGLGNTYLPVVLLERLDEIADPGALDRVFREFLSEYGSTDGGLAKA